MKTIKSLFTMLALLLFTGTAAIAQVVQITPDIAREKALSGEIVLIDVRRPDEWADTGVPDVALLADMTDPDFLQMVKDIRAQRPDVLLAFSCRSGVRSGRVTAALNEMGMTGIVDVIGGMSGGSGEIGWAARGLPIRDMDAPVNPAILFTQP